jgi:hypothetical protein
VCLALLGETIRITPHIKAAEPGGEALEARIVWVDMCGRVEIGEEFRLARAAPGVLRAASTPLDERRSAEELVALAAEKSQSDIRPAPAEHWTPAPEPQVSFGHSGR